MASSTTRAHLDLRKVRTCPHYKVGYATHDEAWTAAEVMMEKGQVDPGCHVTPYQCKDCGQWHVYNRQIVAIGVRSRSTAERLMAER